MVLINGCTVEDPGSNSQYCGGKGVDDKMMCCPEANRQHIIYTYIYILYLHGIVKFGVMK